MTIATQILPASQPSAMSQQRPLPDSQPASTAQNTTDTFTLSSESRTKDQATSKNGMLLPTSEATSQPNLAANTTATTPKSEDTTDNGKASQIEVAQAPKQATNKTDTTETNEKFSTEIDKPQNSAPPGQDEVAPLFILQLGTAEVEYTQAPPPSTTEAENSHPHSLNPVPNGQTIPAQVNSQRLHYADFLFAGSMPKSSYLRAAEAKKQPEPAPVHSPAEDAALKKEKAQQERLRIETIYERMRVERKLHEAKRLAIIADLQTELQRIWREVILRRQKAEDDYHKSWQKVFLGVS